MSNKARTYVDSLRRRVRKPFTANISDFLFRDLDDSKMDTDIEFVQT